MAEVIPKLSEAQISKIEPKSEQKVYKSLVQQLPSDWLIIHSLEFVKKTSIHNSHGDREADFVVFAPQYGVLVIEVKGGGIEYNGQTRQWYSIDRNQKRHEIKNPLKQAKDAKYEIRNHLKEKMRQKNILIAHGALLPDISNLNSLVSPDIPIDILGNSETLKDLKSWIISIFKFWAGEQPNYDPLELSGINIAKSIYGKEINIQPSLASIIENEIEQQILLTNQQKSILRQLKKRKEAIIEGGAGTGKTVLALDHAQTLANQAFKVLLLCYNQKLGNILKEKSQGIENLHSMNFHEFCSWRIRQVKSDTNRDLLAEAALEYPNEDKYDVLMPTALIDSYAISPIKYDVIIIDEGQDFKDEYWYAIEELRDLNKDTKLYIFKDSNQAIYSSSDELPIDCEPLFLFDNCRNTKPIHNLAYKYYQGEEVDAPEIEGEEPRYIIKETLEKQVLEIDKTISHLINNEGINREDIAILVMNNFYTAKGLLEKSRNHKLWAFKEFSPKNKVLVETAKRFKGLEAKIIFLWILDSSSIDEKLLYVSISRARFRLFIIGDNSTIGL
ncbi:NERD domain-containing protein [Hydrogenimonas sp.]